MLDLRCLVTTLMLTCESSKRKNFMQRLRLQPRRHKKEDKKNYLQLIDVRSLLPTELDDHFPIPQVGPPAHPHVAPFRARVAKMLQHKRLVLRKSTGHVVIRVLRRLAHANTKLNGTTRAPSTTGGPARPSSLAFSFGATFTVCIRSGKKKSACHDSS